MTNYKLISDSSCDLPKSFLLENDIDIVPYYVTFDGVKYFREGVDIEIEEFYERLLQKDIFPKTSLPSIQDYYDVFKRYLEQGSDIICLCLTAKFSGSYQSAFNAKNMLSEEFPNNKIEVIDSCNVTLTQGYMLMQMAQMKKAGLSFSETVALAEKIKHDRRVFFTLDTLEFLQRGGRIGRATALAGTVFNIKPILLFDEGELVPHSKARGRKKAVAEVIDLFEKDLAAKPEGYEILIAHNACREEAEEFLALMQSKGYNITVPIFNIGATISVHSGPKVLGIGYFRKYDTIL